MLLLATHTSTHLTIRLYRPASSSLAEVWAAVNTLKEHADGKLREVTLDSELCEAALLGLCTRPARRTPEMSGSGGKGLRACQLVEHYPRA